ncbi:MAG TPA: hypothetical protein VJ476_04730 [Rhizomicrobium sp.]|nr:hypothetical protein [Rhizomicrobium sp.]
MAQANQISLVIEGLPEDEGRVRVNTFIAQIQSLYAALSKIDRETNNGRTANAFEIAELSYASPYRVVVEPRAIEAHVQTGAIIIERLGILTHALTNGESLSSVDADLLEDIRALARPVGKNVKSATILFNGTELDLTPRVSARVDEALAVVDECAGFIEGMLEQINIHQGANTFHIYPEVGPRKVTCHFPSSLFDDAVAAVGRKVEVFGTLRYRLGAIYPHQIAVSEVIAFPPADEIPDWNDLRGRAPDATGKLSSEAFIAELRDAWN